VELWRLGLEHLPDDPGTEDADKLALLASTAVITPSPNGPNDRVHC
jgi:hypothetical protein